MAKGHREDRSAKANGREKAARADPEVKAEATPDVLTHTEAMAKAVEDKVREAAQKTIADVSPAVAAERLVQMAETELVKQEAVAAAKEAVQHPVETARRVGIKVADDFVEKAEKRLANLPEPVKKLGRLAEKAVSTAFWPARFGLRLAGELLRTPVALARILFRRSRPA